MGKNYFLAPVLLWSRTMIWKKWTKTLNLDVYLDIEFPVWKIFVNFKTSKIYKLQQLNVTLLDLGNLLPKNELGVIMLHLVSQVGAFMVTWLQILSAYMLK